MDYEIYLPTSKPFLKVTLGREKNSTKLGVLLHGDSVTVVEKQGDRAKISRPVEGWCSFRNRTKGFEYLRHTRWSPGAAETMLNNAHKNSFWMRLLEIKDRIHEISKQQEIIGMSNTRNGRTSGRQSRKILLEEYFEPKLEWSCSNCTFNNPPEVFLCSKCKSAKSCQIQSEVGWELLMKTPGWDEGYWKSKITISERKDELLSSQIDNVRRYYWNLSESYREAIQRMYGLEDANELLADRAVKAEEAFKTCNSLYDVDPKDWDISMVSIWLHKNGLDMYQSDFSDADVDGEALLTANEKLLQELNIRRQHWPIILSGVFELQKKSIGCENESLLVDPEWSPLLSAGESEDLMEAVNSPMSVASKESMGSNSQSDFSLEVVAKPKRVSESYMAMADEYIGRIADNGSAVVNKNSTTANLSHEEDWELVNEF